ncbi:MAG: germination protein YpeB [Clostridia bacterium]|nr:germination protein YpeB [Clostridia bacterium]
MADDSAGARRSANNWPYALLVLITVVSLTYGFAQMKAKQRLEVAVENQYFHAFYDLLGNVDNVRTAIAKSLAAGSPRLRVGALSDVWREASNAQANLNSLPVSQSILVRTSAFLTQVSDFAFSTARKAADQQMMSAEDWKRLSDMKAQSQDLSNGLSKMEAQAAAGKVSWVRVAEQARAGVRKSGGGNTGAKLTTAVDGVTDGLTKVDEQIQTFPTLIYDGPFSDHIEARKPVGVTGAPITAEQAKEIAMRFVPFDASAHSAKVEEEVRSKIPAYRIQLDAPKNSGKPNAVVDVTKVGGHVTLMNVARDLAPKKLDLDDAVSRAHQFLAKVGMVSMTPTFVSEAADAAVIPFIYQQGNVLVYPDLIKVKVALDSGDVIGYDATGYFMSHTARKLPEPKVKSTEAKELLSPGFVASDPAKLAVIPVETVAAPEAFCWEFHGTSYGDEFFVYVNAESGREEKLLQIVKTPEGKLTM